MWPNQLVYAAVLTVASDVTLCALKPPHWPVGVDNAGQSRRAWPLTHGSASQAAQMMTIGQAQGTPLGHQRSLWPTGQRGEVDKWTEGQRHVSRGSVGSRHHIALTSIRVLGLYANTAVI